MMDRINKTPEPEAPVVVNGAGLTGCTLALYLAQKGFKVVVYDKRKDFRDEYENKKRTVGMTLSERGIETLKDLGIYDLYRTTTSTMVPKYGRAVHQNENTIFYQEYGGKREAVYSINRKDFNVFLMDQCTETGKVDFFFNHNMEAINFQAKRILFNGPGNKKKRVSYSHLFGCDGAFSSVRTQMNSYGLIESDLHKLDLLFKEIYIPPRNDDYPFHKNYLHIWNIPELLFVATPDDKQGFNGTLFYSRASAFAQLSDKEQLSTLLNKNCHFLAYIDKAHFINEFVENPVSEIYAATSSRWNYKGEVLLMGDSAHAMPPFYGMGMNTCMESARMFAKLMDQLGGDLTKAINQFTELRIADAEAMTKMAFTNYDNLKNCHTDDFDRKWREERELMNIKGDDYTTEYFQVAFTNKPFQEILKAFSGKEQKTLLNH